jgi:hypothetical protein
MIAGDEQLEGGEKFEKVLAHEPRRDDVTAGQLLDAAFGPATPLASTASKRLKKSMPATTQAHSWRR